MRRFPGVQVPRGVPLRSAPLVPRAVTPADEVVVHGNFVWGEEPRVTFDGPGDMHLVSLPLDGGSVVLVARSKVSVSGNGYTFTGEGGAEVLTVEAGTVHRFTRWDGEGGWRVRTVLEEVPPREEPVPVLVPVHVTQVETRARAGSLVRDVVRQKVGPS